MILGNKFSSSAIKTFLSELIVFSPTNIPIKGISFFNLFRRKSSICSSIAGMICCRLAGSVTFSSIIFIEKNCSATNLPASVAIADCFAGKMPCIVKPKIDLAFLGRKMIVEINFTTSQPDRAQANGIRKNDQDIIAQLKINPDEFYRDLQGG